MFGCKCFYWNEVNNMSPTEPGTFSLPAPLPTWPQGITNFGLKRLYFLDEFACGVKLFFV